MGVIKLSVYLLGIDVGGTKTAIILGDEDFHIIDRKEFPTNPEDGFRAFLEHLSINTAPMINKVDLNAVGISIGGPLDARKGILYNPPHLGWGKAPLGEEMRKIFYVPVKVEHDAKAGALAEWKMGAGKGFLNIVFLTLGTGLGAGIIVNGKVYRGASDTAGEVGHIRIEEDGPLVYGKVGSWEAYCSGDGISKLAHFMFPLPFVDVTAAEISNLAISGDPKAVKVLRKSGEYLGKGLAILFDILDPDRIILGSLSWRLPDLWIDTAKDVVKREALEGKKAVPRIVKSELRDKIGDFAALIVASEAMGQA